MNILYNSAKCGGGKTVGATEMMATNPGKWIYSINRKSEMSARKLMIDEAAKLAGTKPRIIFLYAGDGHDSTMTIGDRIANIPNDFDVYEHVVVIICHAGMKLCPEWSFAFKDWFVIIDEDPKAFACLDLPVNIDSNLQHLASNYDLVPEGDLSRVVPKACCPSPRQYSQDGLMGEGALEFRVRAGRDRLLTKTGSWEDFASMGRKILTCFSVWSLRCLSECKGVLIIANAIEETLTFKLSRLDRRISFTAFNLVNEREWQPRPVRIVYFVEDHVAGTGLWSGAGSHIPAAFLRAIASYQDRPSDHYWVSNLKIGIPDDVAIPGQRVSPRIAGSNAFRGMTKCSVLYSAKASPTEAMALRLLSKDQLDGDDIRRDRECEDIVQVAMRSSLRVPDDTRPVEIRVYDVKQAEFLREYLRRSYGFRVSLEYRDIGIDQVHFGEAQKRGRKLIGTAPLNSADRQARYRAKARAKKNGTTLEAEMAKTVARRTSAA